MQKVELPILDIFPVTTRPHTPMELALTEHDSEPLRKIRTYDEPITLIQSIIDADGTGDAASAYESALKESDQYKKWQKSVPRLKDAPHMLAYRTEEKHKNDIQAINEELQNVGAFLSAGQVLYRGAVFSSSSFFTDATPVSTTMFPSVARWHAINSCGHIGVLTVAETQSVIAFPYGSAGNQRLKHEYEVLLLGALKFDQTSQSEYGGFVIKHYDIWRNDD